MGSYEEWTQTNEEDARARESEDTRRLERAEVVLERLRAGLGMKSLPRRGRTRIKETARGVRMLSRW
jgi:hypothetical protein